MTQENKDQRLIFSRNESIFSHTSQVLILYRTNIALLERGEKSDALKCLLKRLLNNVKKRLLTNVEKTVN